MENDQALVPSTPADVPSLEELPFALAGLLERRYLDGFAAEDWHVVPLEETAPHRPLLREVKRLGRPAAGIPFHSVMSGVLAACHEPGHALVLMLQGGAEGVRLWIGTRRLPGAQHSTSDTLDLVAGTFTSALPGLDFSQAGGPTVEARSEPAALLARASCFAALTGVPSAVATITGLERLEGAVRDGEFLLQIVAEPLDPWILDGTLDTMRRMRGEVHSLAKRTRNQAEATTITGRGGQNTPGTTSNAMAGTGRTGLSRNDLPLLLAALGGVMQMVGLLPSWGRIAQLSGPLQSMAFMANMRNMLQPRGSPEQRSESRTTTAGTAFEEIDASAEAAEQLLSHSIERLEAARAGGWWRTAVYLAAESQGDLRRLAGALKGPLCGAERKADPIRILRPTADSVRDAMCYGRFLTLTPKSGTDGNTNVASIGGGLDGIVTCLSGPELAAWISMPQHELPGLPMREKPAFAVAIPPCGEHDLPLGRLAESRTPIAPMIPVSSATLNRNVLVSGIIGSGKTNTCMHLLMEAYERWNVPFLVLEPVKNEYRMLAADPRLIGRLTVYAAGDDAGGMPLRLNPLEPAPGFPVARHLDLLKAVFNSAFPMFAGMSYVLEEALVEVYEDRGWSFRGGPEPASKAARDEVERATLWPDLRELHDKIEIVLKRKGYGTEIHANLGAALRSRVASLMIGQKGVLLDTRRSIPLASLFERPCVVELQTLGDDDEKAFVMALIFVLLCEHAELRQANAPPGRRTGLQHLTLIEEAHRLLAECRRSSAAETADPRGKAVAMFTDLLAELRAYGEGFIVADQIPTKLAPETAKNTALKIVHRLTSADDRRAMAECCDLTSQQMRALNGLAPGRAVVHDQRLGEAVLVDIALVATKLVSTSVLIERASGSLRYLEYGGGCSLCMEACRHLRGLEGSMLQAAAAARLRPLLEGLLWAVGGVVAPLASRLAASVWRQDQTSGRVFCGLLGAARAWLTESFKARYVAAGGHGPRPSDRVATERALTGLGPVLRALADNMMPTEDCLEAAKSVLRATVLACPPRARPGCGSCPDPCRALQFVASAVRTEGRALRPLVMGAQDASLRATAFVAQALPGFKAPSGVEDARRLRSGWLHCLAVQLAGEEGDEAEPRELLERLDEALAPSNDGPLSPGRI